MSEPFIGEVMLVGWNFAARGWALCEGQLLAINQNQALFSLLGTTFGGDGRTTFGLPDLRGRVPVGVGNGPGLQSVVWGERGGANTVTQTIQTMANHSHTITINPGTAGTQTAPTNAKLGSSTVNMYAASGTNGRPMAADAASAAATGGSQPMNIMQPFTGMYYEIALVGIFPSRS